MSEPAPTPAPTRRGAPAVCWGIDPGARAGAARLSWDQPEPTGRVAVNRRRDPRRKGNVEPVMDVPRGAFRAEMVVGWTTTAAGVVVTSSTGLVATFDNMHDVGGYLSAMTPGPYRLSVEGLYIDDPAKAQSILTLAESRALVYGPLLSGSSSFRAPLWATWTARIFRLTRTRNSIDAAEWLSPGCLGELGDNEHAADGVCIAAHDLICAARTA